ncbi:MAG: pyridoxal-phosphate dependent enzyme [Thermodesulfobacteriota bacterium]
MNVLAASRDAFRARIDQGWAADQSVVLRYRRAVRFLEDPDRDARLRELLGRTSIREGARLLPLLHHRGVALHVLDETSRMHTRTLKSIDGCVTTAFCVLDGGGPVVFESGGNTGSALAAYGERAGIETYFFCPAENVPLLNSRRFSSPGSHLVAVEKPGFVKEAAYAFARRTGFRHVPDRAWRHAASVLRGCFLAERAFEGERFDWVVQTVSAAFGPIGVFRVLEHFGSELAPVPRFLGIQQDANCPMYRAWKGQGAPGVPQGPAPLESTSGLLSRVMYDAAPQTYETYGHLDELLRRTGGDLGLVDRRDFEARLDRAFGGKTLLELLGEHGVPIAVSGGEVLEKTGLLALVGALKAIDGGRIPAGSRVLCCLTSGASDADGRARPECTVASEEDVVRYAAERGGAP